MSTKLSNKFINTLRYLMNSQKSSFQTLARISIIRHGEINNFKNSNIKTFYSNDISLTETGKKEAYETLRQYRKPDILILSPRLRCIQTAEAWFNKDFSKIESSKILMDNLKEIDAGKLEAMHENEIEKKFKKLWYLWKNEPQNFPGYPKGESLIDMQTRVFKTFSKITNDYGNLDLNVSVITHGVPMRILKCFLEDKPLSELWKYNIYNLFKFDLDKEEIGKLQKYNDNKITKQNNYLSKRTC